MISIYKNFGNGDLFAEPTMAVQNDLASDIAAPAEADGQFVRFVEPRLIERCVERIISNQVLLEGTRQES
jgi:hypothetical protein